VGAYRVFVDPRAEKELARLPNHVLWRMAKKIASLADDPRPHGSKKLAGREGYRSRQGDYRALYAVNNTGQFVTVLRVAHRSDVYDR